MMVKYWNKLYNEVMEPPSVESPFKICLDTTLVRGLWDHELQVPSSPCLWFYWFYDFSIHATCTTMSPTASSCSISVCGMKTPNWRRVVGHRVGMQEGCGGWAAFCSIADPPSTPCHGHGQALTVHLWHPTDDLSMNEDEWDLDGEGDAEGQAQDKFHKIWGNCFNKYCAQGLRLMGQAWEWVWVMRCVWHRWRSLSPGSWMNTPNTTSPSGCWWWRISHRLGWSKTITSVPGLHGLAAAQDHHIGPGPHAGQQLTQQHAVHHPGWQPIISPILGQSGGCRDGHRAVCWCAQPPSTLGIFRKISSLKE